MKKFVIATVAGIGMVSAAAVAQDKTGTNESDKKVEITPAVKSVQQIETAHALAAWGRETDNPQALLIAARMLGGVETRAATAGEGKLATAKGKTASAGTVKAEPVTRDSLLAEAEAMGGDDPDFLAHVTAAKSEGSKGVVAHATGSGPIAYGRVVPSYTDWSYELQAQGGQPLRIAAIGDGAADIDMEVSDENGYVVCKDYDSDATPVCSVTPAWTGKFSAKVINKTGAASYVRLISN